MTKAKRKLSADWALKQVEKVLPFRNDPCDCSADLVFNLREIRALMRKKDGR